jgi:hypothetical protein
MPKIDESLEAMIMDDAHRKPQQDKLEFVRNQVRAMRDLQREIEDVEDLARRLRGKRREMEMQILPDLFMQTGVTHIGLAAEGNEPPYEAKMHDHYHAVISADWPLEKRQLALDWVENNNLGDLIKTVIIIELGKGQSKLTTKVLAALRALKVPFIKQQNVPWNTLTAAIKEMYRDGRVLSDTDLSTIGAVVGKIVKLKAKKED